MNEEKLIQYWKQEEQEAFKGWDFSHLDGRLQEEQLAWDYREEIDKHLRPFHKMLDMGTGGGEFLLSLQHPYENTYVTEAYEPNIKLCLQKLAPLGIFVSGLDSDNGILPFDDASMDIILNRHESFDCKEVHRVLKEDGVFITQQVGPKNNLKLSKALLGHTPDRESYDNASEDIIYRLKSVGFNVIKSEESFLKQKFFDIGALVYFAKIICWEFPGFKVNKHLEHLLLLQEQLEKDGFIEGDEHRYLIVAKKIKRS